MLLQPRQKLLSIITALFMVVMPLWSTAANGQQDACSASLGQATASLGQELSNELEILSWNIQKASNDGWADDLATLGENIDLAFIQEASMQAGIPQIIPNNMHSVFAAGYTTASMETGVMTLSNGTPSTNCQLAAMEPWLRTPKATGITEHTLQGREDRLLAINLHAVNFDLGLQSLLAQLGALQDVLSRHKGPVILAGDLNTWSGPRQAAVDDFMQQHGLGSVSFEPDLRTTAFGRALDHIYVRGLQAQFAQVIPVSTSDHNPLRVRLTIQ